MKTILIHLATLLCAGLWWFLAFVSLFISTSALRHELREWSSALAAIALPFLLGALYVWRGWSLLGLPPLISGVALVLPGVLALSVHGSGLLHVLRARTLHRSVHSVYYLTPQGIQVNNDLIQDCDPATFRVIGGAYTRDRSHVFFLAEKVSGADPDSFRWIGCVPNADETQTTFDAEDASHKFREGAIVR